MRGLLLGLVLAMVAGVPGLAMSEPTELGDRIVVPEGWTLTSARDLSEVGAGLDVFTATSGTVVLDWVEASHEAALVGPGEVSFFAYAHRFDNQEHARQAWLAVLRLAEEPDLAVAPRVLDRSGDTLAFGSTSGLSETESVLLEEVHRVVGRDVVLLVRVAAAVSEGVPSELMGQLVDAHIAAFPQDQFDLPRPSTQRDIRFVLLLTVLLLGGGVTLVSSILLLRRRDR